MPATMVKTHWLSDKIINHGLRNIDAAMSDPKRRAPWVPGLTS